MDSKNPLEVAFKVSPYAESKNSMAFLCIEGVEAGSWNTLKWFPKSLCKVDNTTILTSKGYAILTAPVWMLQKMGIHKKVTIVK